MNEVIVILIGFVVLLILIGFLKRSGKTAAEIGTLAANFVKRPGQVFGRQRGTPAPVKTLRERNQDIIEKYFDSISHSTRGYYIENLVRDCIGEIATRERRNDLVPAPREWLRRWQIRKDIPADYLELKEYLKVRFQVRYDDLEKKKREAEEEKVQEEGKTILERNRDLVEKFLAIAERKVSVIDDYGDENWDALPIEVQTCLRKIAEREGTNLENRFVRSMPKRGAVDGTWLYMIPEEYRWLYEELTAMFRERHLALKQRTTGKIPDLQNLSGIEFETHVANLLRARGYDVAGTPKTGDQGADIIAKKEGKTVVVQTKRYQAQVGNKAVQEAIAAVQFYGADEGWVVTNSTFSPSAKALAQKANIKLIDGTDLRNGSSGKPE